MNQLEHPSEQVWEQRRKWFENKLEEKQHPLGSYLVSDQATALLVDLQSCYCSGAWLAIIFLSVSIIDAQLREMEASDQKINTARLFTDYSTGNDIHWLRQLRNRYVHVDLSSPALVIDDQYNKRNFMKADAERAINLVMHAFFQSPGT